MLTLNRNKKRKANPIQQDDTVAKKPAVRRFFSFRSPTPFGNLFIFCLPRILPHRFARFGASPCSGPVTGHLRRRGLGQSAENKGDV